MTTWVKIPLYCSVSLLAGSILVVNFFSLDNNPLLEKVLTDIVRISLPVMVISIVYIFVKPLLIFCPKCKKRCKFHTDEYGRASALKCPECKSIYEMDGIYYWD